MFTLVAKVRQQDTSDREIKEFFKRIEASGDEQQKNDDSNKINHFGIYDYSKRNKLTNNSEKEERSNGGTK